MSKVSDFFLHFKKKYDDEQRRLARMDRFLDRAEQTEDAVKTMTLKVSQLSDQITDIGSKVDKLQARVNQIDERLEIIGKGTKIELFNTLYNWKKRLVDARGWASEPEKKEVKEIYEVYHDGLKGNGQGEVYYKQVMELPENDPKANN